MLSYMGGRGHHHDLQLRNQRAKPEVGLLLGDSSVTTAPHLRSHSLGHSGLPRKQPWPRGQRAYPLL
jgi:hypothetical protein